MLRPRSRDQRGGAASYRAVVYEHVFDEVLAGVLEVVELRPGPSFVADVGAHAARLDPSVVLLALPAGGARVIDRSSVLDLFAESGATVVVEPEGDALVGLAGALTDPNEDDWLIDIT